MKISAPTSAPALRLLGAGRFEMALTRPSATISQKVWVLELITAGRLEVSVEEALWQTYERGSGLWYAPGTRYRERMAAHDDICCSICLFIEVGHLPPSREWERFTSPYFTICDAEAMLLPLAEQTLHHLGLSAADDLLATGYFLQLMAHLLRAKEQHQMLLITHESGEEGDLVAHCHRFMRAQLAQPLSLPQLAAEAGLSVSGFSHAYKRQTGLSPMAALRQMRIEAVRSHLLRNRLTLAQIAQETGFADAFHLSRSFKQATGISPRHFRRGVTEL